MTGLQNTTDSLSTDSLSLLVNNFRLINTVTKSRCERAADLCRPNQLIVPQNHTVHCSTKPKGSIFLLIAKVDTAFWLCTAVHNRPTSANWLSLGTDYCITFTPPIVSKDFNKLNRPSFQAFIYSC